MVVRGATMRPVRIIATTVFVAALAGTGCTAHRTTDHAAASASSGASSVTTTQPTAGSTGTTTATVPSPATASCAVAPTTGHLPGQGPPQRQGRLRDLHRGQRGQRHLRRLTEDGRCGVSGDADLPRVCSLRTS